MAKRKNTAVAERYDLTDLEPDVDPAKADAFLATTSRSQHDNEPKTVSEPNESAHRQMRRAKATAVKQPIKPDPWTSRTVRLRQTTADALTKAAYAQKTKKLEAKLNQDEPVTAQEIAEQGIRHVLTELGYLK